jgi:hypothetical protein
MRYCYWLFLSIVFISCKADEKSSLEKVWFYDDELTKQEQLENVYKYGGTMEYGFGAASFMNLQQDGKFTSYFSAFDYGDWKLQDSMLILTNHNKGRLLLEVKRMDPKHMICVNRSNHKVYRFNGFKNEIASDAENPFSIKNNLWRVKANHNESDAELAARLKNHFKWWEKYFSWGLNNKFKVLDIRSTPSVLDMYANGFQLKYYDYQFPEWKNIFYDTTNCWRAYEMVYYLMYKKDINWPKTENRFEGFVSAFKQLQQWMDIDPKTYLPAKDSINSQTTAKKTDKGEDIPIKKD